MAGYGQYSGPGGTRLGGDNGLSGDIGPTQQLAALQTAWNRMASDPDAAFAEVNSLINNLNIGPGFANQASNGGAYPGSFGCCTKPDFVNAVCGAQSRTDWRRPVISELRHTLDNGVDIVGGADVIAAVFADIFPALADRRIFFGDDANYRAQVLGRVLVGIEIDIKTSGNVSEVTYVTDGAGGAVASATHERLLTYQELIPLERKLYEILVECFRDSSETPWMTSTPASYFFNGTDLPDFLAVGNAWYDEQANVRLSAPPTNTNSAAAVTGVRLYAPTTGAAANASLNISCSICVRGLYVDPSMVMDFMRAYGAHKLSGKHAPSNG